MGNHRRGAIALGPADRFHAEILATLSHELRTPLHVILSYAEMLEERGNDPEQRSDCVRRIKTAASGLVELVDRALGAAEAEAVSPAPASAVETTPILVVEDDYEVREAMLAVLEACGHPAVGAANGHEALRVLRAGPRPSLIILDLMMPVMDGWEFRAVQLLEDDLATIPTLVCSALGEQETRARSMGVIAHLRKPVDFDRLLDIVESHCPAH